MKLQKKRFFIQTLLFVEKHFFCLIWMLAESVKYPKTLLFFLSKMSLFLFWLKCFGAVYIQTENIQWLFEDKLVTKFDRKINFLFWQLDRFAKFRLLQSKQIVGILQLFWYMRIAGVWWLRQRVMTERSWIQTSLIFHLPFIWIRSMEQNEIMEWSNISGIGAVILLKRRKGQKYKNQNVESQKRTSKIWKGSERRKFP